MNQDSTLGTTVYLNTSQSSEKRVIVCEVIFENNKQNSNSAGRKKEISKQEKARALDNPDPDTDPDPAFQANPDPDTDPDPGI